MNGTINLLAFDFLGNAQANFVEQCIGFVGACHDAFVHFRRKQALCIRTLLGVRECRAQQIGIGGHGFGKIRAPPRRVAASRAKERELFVIRPHRDRPSHQRA